MGKYLDFFIEGHLLFTVHLKKLCVNLMVVFDIFACFGGRQRTFHDRMVPRLGAQYNPRGF